MNFYKEFSELQGEVNILNDKIKALEEEREVIKLKQSEINEKHMDSEGFGTCRKALAEDRHEAYVDRIGRAK